MQKQTYTRHVVCIFLCFCLYTWVMSSCLRQLTDNVPLILLGFSKQNGSFLSNLINRVGKIRHRAATGTLSPQVGRQSNGGWGMRCKFRAGCSTCIVIVGEGTVCRRRHFKGHAHLKGASCSFYPESFEFPFERLVNIFGLSISSSR